MRDFKNYLVMYLDEWYGSDCRVKRSLLSEVKSTQAKPVNGKAWETSLCVEVMSLNRTVGLESKVGGFVVHVSGKGISGVQFSCRIR